MVRAFVFIVSALLGFQISFAQNDTLNQVDNEGMKSGYWIGKYPSGEIMYKGFFLKGKPVGTLIRYYRDGTIKARLTQQDDKQYFFGELYDESESLRASGSYFKQKKQGEWNFYSSEGTPILRIQYNNDSLMGEAIRYYANGEIMEITHWQNQNLSGQRLVFNDKGTLILDCRYENGKMQGIYKAFSDSGILIAYGKYESGRKEGLWQYFRQDGTLEIKTNYQMGVPVNHEAIDSLQNAEFMEYEKNRLQLKDPLDYLDDPFAYIKR